MKRAHLISTVFLLSILTVACGKPEESAQAKNGLPPPIPVQWQTLKTSTLQASSEYVGTLEAEQTVALKPQIDGRIQQILVKPGDRITQGKPIFILNPDQTGPQLMSAQASLKSAIAARSTATQQLRVSQSQLASAQSQYELARTNNQRYQDLVRQGAIAQATAILQIYGFYSPNDQYDSVFISNYVDLYTNDEIARINGIGLVTISGQHQYAMRIWLDPNALASRGLTVGDVENAVKSQNLVIGGGAIGGDPAPKGQKFEIPLVLDGQFQKAADAENLVVKTASNGSLIKINDVGRVELAALAYNSVAKVNGKPGVALNIYQLPGSNALSIEKLVKAKMDQLQQNFPPGLTVVPVYDLTFPVIF